MENGFGMKIESKSTPIDCEMQAINSVEVIGKCPHTTCWMYSFCPINW